MPGTPVLYARHPQVLRGLFTIIATMIVLTGMAAFSPARAATASILHAIEASVTLRSADPKDRFLGSGFAWGGDGLIVTNAHVVGALDTVRVIDAQGRSVEGTIIGSDAVRDVAVIAVANLGVPGLTPGPVPALGDDVWAIGAPLEMAQTLTRGIVSAQARQVEAAVPIRLIQHDAAVNPGSSGGPLVNAEGQLVGMNSRIADGSRHYIGISFAIGAEDLARIVAGLVDETLPPFPKLGVLLRPVSLEIATALGRDATGLLIDRVQPGGMAEKAGLLAGDILVSAGGAPMLRAGDLAFAIEAALEAAVLDLSLWRDGQDITLSLPLTDTAKGSLATRGMEGAEIQRITSYRLEGLGLLLDDEARLTTVTENSPALFAGLIRGDVILAINGSRMNAADLRRLDITAPALIRVQRAGGVTLHVILDPWDGGEGIRPMGGANVLDPAIVVF